MSEKVALILTEINRPSCLSRFSAKVHLFEPIQVELDREMNSLQNWPLETDSSMVMSRLQILQAKNSSWPIGRFFDDFDKKSIRATRYQKSYFGFG